MIAALGLSLVAANPQDPASAKDLEGLQGTWKLVSAMQDGKALPDDKVRETTIVFKHDTFHFPELAEYATSRSGTIKLDATQKPKYIDAVSTNKEVMIGIYELEGDSLQSLLRPGRQATSQRIRFQPRKWLYPPSLGAEEERLITEKQEAADSRPVWQSLASILPSACHSERSRGIS
jgi:uncharacterized protein (TIGR03067 family)